LIKQIVLKWKPTKNHNTQIIIQKQYKNKNKNNTNTKTNTKIKYLQNPSQHSTFYNKLFYLTKKKDLAIYYSLNKIK